MAMALIEKEIILAMKAKDKVRVGSLRYIKSLLLENTKAVKPKSEMDIMLIYKKTLEKSIKEYSAFKKNVDGVQYDLDVLCSFLPKPMSNDEILEAILEIKTTKNIVDFPSLMKESMSHLKGKVNGEVVSSLIKQVLS